MYLARPRNRGFTGAQLAFLAVDVEETDSLHNIVDLVRCGMAVDFLLLTRPETVKVAKIFRGLKEWNFLDPAVREMNEIANSLDVHRFGLRRVSARRLRQAKATLRDNNRLEVHA